MERTDDDPAASGDRPPLPPVTSAQTMACASSLPPQRVGTATSAVIRSPMTIAIPQTESPTGAVPHQTYQQQQQMPLSRDNSPVSTTTAGEYAAIEQKQLELRSVVEHRIVSLERELARRGDELQALREQLRKTEEDYQFNYDLIADRDGALEEAAAQMQRVYDELRRTKADCSSALDRVEVLERERDDLRRRLRDSDARCEEVAQRMLRESAAQHSALREAGERCAAETESERRRLHDEYLSRLSALDETRAALAAQQQQQQAEQQQQARQLVEQQAQQLAQQQAERLGDQQQIAGLVAEVTELRGRAASHAQQLATQRLEQDEYARRAAAEMREAQQRIAMANAATESAQQRCAEAQAQCDDLKVQVARGERVAREAVAREAQELEVLQRRAEDARADAVDARQQLAAARDEYERERFLLSEQLSTAQRSLREAQREAEQRREESERTVRQRHEECERAQTEIARLTRELHASEAAREACKERTSDSDAHHVVADSLRREKEALAQRVLELERTNAAVREQVSAFAAELQNDPVVRDARETARRADALQSELSKEREESERLRVALREKEAEVARYQQEILREPQAHARLREEYQTAKEAYERMRRGLQEREREMDAERRERRRQSPKSTSDGEEEAEAESEAEVHRRERPARAGKTGRTHSSVKGRVSDAVLMREAELWRRKCVQLEEQLREAVRERDGLTRELRAARREAETAVAERQSLVDLNALLKAQLREAYRTAIDFPHPHAQHTRQRQLQTHTQPATQAQSSHWVCDSAGESTVAAQSPPLAVSEVHSGAATQLRGKSSLEAERIAALEEEIAAVKAHMVMQRSARPATQQQQQKLKQTRHQLPGQQPHAQRTAMPVPRREASATRGPVVQRGTTAVRHYGYT